VTPPQLVEKLCAASKALQIWKCANIDWGSDRNGQVEREIVDEAGC